MICTEWHWPHTQDCYTQRTVPDVKWEGNETDKYSSDAAIAQTTQLKTNHPSAELVAIGFGTSEDNKVVSKTSNTSLDQSYTTGTVDFDAILSDISSEITDAVGATGTVVTDPMSDYVTFGKIQSGIGGTFENGTLSWDLSQANKTESKDGDYTVTTYTLTYRVKVNRTAEFYDAVKKNGSVPTNGTTTLPYKLGDSEGTLEFIVPTVKSEMPNVKWRIEYYQQQNATAGDYEKYTKVGTDVTGNGEYGTQVVLSDKDADYKGKYAKDNYEWKNTENETLTIGLDPDENVIKVYYDRKTTSAVVNYHYELTIINEDGETTTTNVVNGTPETGLFVGDEYRVEAPETSQFGDYTYSFDHADPSTTIKALDKDGSKNVIDLYYKATIDERADASVVVNHVYTLHTYELKDGKYVEKVFVTKVDKVEEETGLKSGDTYSANTTPRAGFNDYQYEGVNGRDNVKTLSDGENVITLRFENWEDPRGPELSLTVKHHYTKSVTDIVDGKVVTTVDPDNVVGYTDTIKFYAGETVTVDKQRVYNGETYEIGGTSDTVTLPNPVDGAEYSLFYTKTVVPETTIVTVNHIYQTVTYETVTTYEEVEKEVQKVDENGEPVFEQKVDENGELVFETVSEPVLDENGEPTVDENGEPIMQDVEKPVMVPVMETVTEKVETGKEVVAKDPVTDDTVTVTDDKVYVGQSYTAPVMGRDGYDCQTNEDGRTAIVAANGATAINVYYLKDEKDNIDDNRDEAIIDVQHRYTTHVTAIVGGEVKEFDTFFTVPGETHEGKAGDTYKATPVRSYDGIEYTLVGEEPAEKVLHAGTNSTIVINYQRDDNQLGEKVDYTVNYEYYTRTMTVENGVAVWGEPVKESETPASSAKGYVGQKVELDTGAKDGYTAYGNNPSATQFLAENGNEWTFKYVKDVELERVHVTVNHHVTTKTLTIDGESSFAQDYMGRPEYKYVGESYEAKALELGENATLTLVNVNGQDVETLGTVAFDGLTGITVVDFYYEIVIDYRHPVNYSIQYYYYDVDYDGAETLTGEPPMTTGSSFVGKTLDTTPEKEDIKGYKLTKATFNGADILDQQFVTLVEGENKVVYVYKRTVDTRPQTSVKVIHEYYASASAETPAFKDEEITNNLRAPSEFTATAKPTKNDVTYTQTTENSALTITLVENAGENVIVIKYVRANTSYQVVHEYYTDGVLSGSTNSVVAGEAGATITADGISKVLSYGGNSYSYTNASGAPLTLVQGENGTITLRYDRTTGSTWTPTGPDYYRLTINYVDEEGNVVAAQYVSGRHTSGWAYDVASPEVEGYTPRQAAVRGTLTRNTTLEVVYTKDVEIEDDNPPLAEPDTFKLTVHYVYADGSVAAEDSVKDGLLAGDSYSVTSPVLEGYTVDYELVAGTMPGEDLEFTVVYTPVETDVPEEQPPLVDVPDVQPPLVDVPDVQPPLVEWPDTAPVVNVPDEQPPLVEVPDEDVPMTGVPQTGDYSMVWYVAALLSALGLIVLTFKKREDEEG